MKKPFNADVIYKYTQNDVKGLKYPVQLYFGAYRNSVLCDEGYGNSKYRTKQSRTKLSVLLVLFLECYLSKNFSILVNKDSEELYLEWRKDKNGTYSAHATKDLCKRVKIDKMDEVDQDLLSLFAFVAWDLLYGANDELKTAFSNIVKDFEKGKGKVENLENVALFCDSFYVYHRKESHLERSCSDDLKIMSIKLAVENEALEYPETTFSLAYLAEPTAVTLKKPSVAKPQKKDKVSSLLQDCMDGKKIIKHEWTDEQKSYIPSIDRLKDFVEIEQFAPLINKLYFRLSMNAKAPEFAFKNFVNFTLTGKPGTGKTNLVYAIAAALGVPVYTIPLSQNTDEDTLTGMTKFVDGKPAAVETDAVKAFKHGGILLLEEVNLTPPAVIMGALGQAVEFPYIMKEDGYKIIHRHPLCVFVSTMNIGTAGSKTVSQPFANRFKQSYVLNDPKKSTFISILMKDDPDADRERSKKRCTWLYDTYSAIVQTIKNENATADVDSILMTLSLRTCFGAIENMHEGVDPIRSVIYSIIGKIAETDGEVAESCQSVLLSRPAPNFE